MSSPAQGGPSAPKEKKGGNRLLSRVKTIIKKAEKRISISGPSGSKQAAAAAATAAKDKKPLVVPADATKVPRSQLYEERARKLGERFGLEIKPNEWHSTEGDALRVNKPIRMRVHRICHNCKTEFGASKECGNCKHVRCKKCSRYPPKRTEAEKIASRERRAQIIKEQKENAPIIPDWDASNRKKVVLTRPAKKGGQDLVYKKPRQRLRRTCCQCDKLFTPGNKTCPGCSHVRCTDCPRDPAKKAKYPFGYPGDEFGAKSIPRYRCQTCKTLYPPDVVNGTPCSNCSEPKRPDLPRVKPQRVDPEPDPEILRSIEARLSKLRVG